MSGQKSSGVYSLDQAGAFAVRENPLWVVVIQSVSADRLQGDAT